MAKKKYHYYVLVLTSYGPVYVTRINSENRTAEWDKLGTPLEMSREDAQYLALALTVNGNHAVCVSLQYEIYTQEYYYSMGEFKWEDNKND